MATPAPLAVVEFGLLRAEARLRPLDHVVDLFVSLLDVAPRLSVVQAARGSVCLFTRVARRVQKDPATDPNLFSHWLARAMETALDRNDLVMAQAIHAIHPDPLDTQSLRRAIQFGTLETVQWLIEHRADRLCCAPGVQNLCAGCVLPLNVEKDPFHIVCWLLDEGVVPLGETTSTYVTGTFFTVKTNVVVARTHTLETTGILRAAQQSVDLTKWLHEKGLFTPSEAERLLLWSIQNSNADIVAFLAEAGYSLNVGKLVHTLLGACVDPKREPVLEDVVASKLCDSIRDQVSFTSFRDGRQKVLQWDAEFMKENPRIAETLERSAGACGHLNLLQWLYYERQVTPDFVGFAVDADEDAVLELLEWLHGVGMTATINMVCFSLMCARRGHIRALQWIVKHDLFDHARVWSLLDQAAYGGHQPMLEWLQKSLPDSGCTTHAMNVAAENNRLDVVEWLHKNRSEGCTTAAMNNAAANGNLDVVKWLHTNRSEGCTESALTWAIENGHLAVVRYLVTSQRVKYSMRELILAASLGQLEILIWLHERGEYDDRLASVMCELIRAPLRYFPPYRLHDFAARDTIGWLSDRYVQGWEGCHPGSYGHSIYNGRQTIMEVAAELGDVALIQTIRTKRNPSGYPSCEEGMETAAIKHGHMGVFKWIAELFAYYMRNHS